jgi:hypothetical protein
LKERTKEKYTEPIRINNALSVVFRRLNSSEAKWMVRMLLKNYSPVHVPETLAKENILYLSRHGYFERVPFAKSVPEFDVSFDPEWQF